MERIRRGGKVAALGLEEEAAYEAVILQAKEVYAFGKCSEHDHIVTL